MFTIAGIKLPVVCATLPLKVKLVLLFAPFVKLVVVVAKVPFTPLARLRVLMVPYWLQEPAHLVEVQTIHLMVV